MEKQKLRTKYSKQIILPDEVKNIMKNLTQRSKESLLRFYGAIYLKFNQKYKNPDGSIDLPTAYLKSVVDDYKRYINLLKDNNIIDVKRSVTGAETYDTERGKSKAYYPLIDINKGELVEATFYNKNITQDWYDITTESLKYLGLPCNIKRCVHGQRLHTPLTRKVNKNFKSYKDFFSNYSEEFICIDASACQPNLLLKYFDDHDYTVDETFRQALKKDFYDYVAENTRISEYKKELNDRETKTERRNLAKKQFCTWLNGNDIQTSCLPISKLFPIVTSTLLHLKKDNYKKVGSDITRLESSIFIDNLLNNIKKELGITFCVTIHDSLIVRIEDQTKVLNWINSKIDYLDFTAKSLKIKEKIMNELLIKSLNICDKSKELALKVLDRMKTHERLEGLNYHIIDAVNSEYVIEYVITNKPSYNLMLNH